MVSWFSRPFFSYPTMGDSAEHRFGAAMGSQKRVDAPEATFDGLLGALSVFGQLLVVGCP